jgi:peptide/nickel transport system substrate-binding protein
MTLHTLRRSSLVVCSLALLVALAAASATASRSGTVMSADKTTLVVAVPDDVATLDPLFAATPRSTEVIMNAYDPLMGYGLRNLPGGLRIWDTRKISGLALASMRVGKDGKTWTLTVRRGVKFPSGNEVTAETVKYMFERNFGVKGSGGAFMYQFMGRIPAVTSVRQTGPMTLQVKTQTPNPLLPRIFALSNSVPFDQQLLKERGGNDPYASAWVSRNTAGAGPYQLRSWTPGSQIVLEANPNYWQGAPAIKSVVMRVVPSAANRMLLLRRGVVDVAERLSAQEIKSLRGASGVRIVSVPSTNTTQLVMNVRTEPFDDVRVRRAIANAVPYAGIIRSVFDRRAQRSTGPVPVGFPLRLAKGYPYSNQNLNRAKQLLAQADKASGMRVTLQINSGNPDHEAVAVLIRDALGRVGITTSIQKLTPAVFAERLAKRQLGFFLNDTLWWVDDPSYALTLGYTCDAFFNYGAYCNKAVDNLIAQAGRTLSATKRSALFARAQRQIIADAPVVWVAQPNFNLATRINVSGYAHFPDEMVRFKYFQKR